MVAQHAAAAFGSLDACLAGLGLVQRHWAAFLCDEAATATAVGGAGGAEQAQQQ